MKIKTAVFDRSATKLSACPPWALPEFAFIGRSNVGKSSLINLLTGKRDLAKVSGTPGKTVHLNFFVVNDAWSLVDLPGYGFAKIARGSRFDFNQMTADYLEQRPNLRRVFVLIDSALPPQEIDLEFVRWLNASKVPYAFVFTKTDRQSASKTHSNAALFERQLAERRVRWPDTFLASAVAKEGRSELLGYIEQVMLEPVRA